MVLKFPSGKVSISVRELQENQNSQSTCGVCDKPWVIKSDGCIMSQLHVLHPCQHLVGSGCWSSVPDDHRDKCPVCKVKIQCNEKVRVHREVERFAPVSQNSPARNTALEKETEDDLAQQKLVQTKMYKGLNAVDVRKIMYYMNLRARLDAVKGSLNTLLASTKTLTPAHRERLVLFFVNTPQSKQDSQHRKVEIALSAFNISGGTNFTMNDLRKALSSAEEWIKRHFAAILMEGAKANEDATSIHKLEKKLADVEAELKELKEIQSKENAKRLESEIKQAVDEIKKKTDDEAFAIRATAREEAVRLRAEAEKGVVKINAKADDDIAKIRAKTNDEIAKLRSHEQVANR